MKLFLHQNKVKTTFVALIRALGFIDQLNKKENEGEEHKQNDNVGIGK